MNEPTIAAAPPEPAAPAAPDSARGLLHEAPEIVRAAPSRMPLIITAFIAYHLVVLLVYNLPSTKGPTQGLHWLFVRYGQMATYIQMTGNLQNWKLFAPNPPQANDYLRVLAEDGRGSVVDLHHDTYGRQRYPYLAYDRMRKVNRRVITEKRYRPIYAAWVCRTWEREHGGVPAAEVRLVHLSTQIPPPPTAFETMGYDPMRLPISESDAGTYRCAEVPHGQLPAAQRRRLQLPPAPEGSFREVSLGTWWDQRHGAKDPARARRDAPGEAAQDEGAIQ